MISKSDILDRANEWQLRPDVVEKDYVLGWFLAGIARNPETNTHWVFKGGTCLKKCYFETYRFSEDLDFSLLPGAQYSAEMLLAILRDVAESVAHLSGLAFPSDRIEVRARQNKQGQATFEARISYIGPLAIPVAPRIRFDLTQHEPILAETDHREVFHAFPDALPEGTRVQAYSIEELFAEKTRALFERTRPRDFYDVGFILENRRDALDLEVARDLFKKKCAVKNLDTPDAATLGTIVRSSAELRSDWANMLAHQLPQLPPLDPRLAELQSLLGWLDAPALATASTLQAVGGGVGETIVAPVGGTYWGGGQKLELVRFAASNRLLVQFHYHGRPRVAEPYSLRRAQTGNLLLYAWETGETHIKAFKVGEITGLQVTQSSFVPRYRIDMTASGPMTVRAAATRPPVTSTPRHSGPTYVYLCRYCQKEFPHSKRDSTLRAHKTPYGDRCSGRRGDLLRVDY